MSKIKASGGEVGSKKIRTVSPYNPETCYSMPFQAPYQPWYGQPMFNPVQLGYSGYG